MGGANTFNQRWVRNSDGSPYISGVKYYFTGDWSALGIPAGGATTAYKYLHQCVFTIDMETFEIECVGHIYTLREDSADPTRRYHGGADMKLTWYADSSKWLCTTVLCDDYDVTDVPDIDDPYVWLDPAEPFGELIVDESRFNQIGINRTTYPNLIYDYSNILFIDGQFELTGAETNTTRGTGWSLVNPIKFRGASLSNITSITQYSSATFLELCSWAYVNRTHWNMFTSFGVNNYYIFNSSFSPIGNLDYSDRTTTGTYIGGADIIPYQHDGITEYFNMTFDTENVTLVDVDGVSKTFAYSLGNFKLYKANETSTGYEYP
jgi:hypothetical protein